MSESRFGNGLFAAKDIRAGARILVFMGPIIRFVEAANMGPKESYALQIGPDTYLDLVAPGCYCNHSCEPNAGVVDDLNLVALVDIERGAEILYDYSTTMAEYWWTMVCRCGSARCRGIVRDFRCIPDDVSASYLERNVVQRFIVHRSGPIERIERLLVGAWRRLLRCVILFMPIVAQYLIPSRARMRASSCVTEAPGGQGQDGSLTQPRA